MAKPSASRSRHRIPPPSPHKIPLKQNAFEFMRGANSTLIPLFPYLDEGSILPAGTVYYGPGDTHFGQFEHYNDVDEVFIVLAARGARFRSGTVRVGPRQHFVGSPFMGSDEKDAMALIVITQRQSVGRPQKERVVFRCGECRHVLCDHEFDATPPPRGRQREVLGPHAPFRTLTEGVAAYERYNENTTCPKCGARNPPFPISLWGNDRYTAQTRLVRWAREELARDMSDASEGAE
jgi:hypothetical protein